MSRQYISTFRRKLNISQAEQPKAKLSERAFYRPKTPDFLKTTRRQSVSDLKIEKTEKHKETKRSNRTKASLEIEQNKIQVGILESALASLRLKEKRALQELEREMRKYRRAADQNSTRRRRQPGYGYNGNLDKIFPPIENEDEVTLKRAGKAKRSPMQLSLCSLSDVIEGNENSDGSADDDVRKKSLKKSERNENDSSVCETSDQNAQKPFFYRQRLSKARDEYLDLIDLFSRSKLSKAETKATNKKDSENERNQNCPSTQNPHQVLRSSCDNRQRTLRFKDMATQFESEYVQDSDISDEIPREIWPSWASPNSKLVQTDFASSNSDSIRKEDDSGCNHLENDASHRLKADQDNLNRLRKEENLMLSSIFQHKPPINHHVTDSSEENNSKTTFVTFSSKKSNEAREDEEESLRFQKPFVCTQPNIEGTSNAVRRRNNLSKAKQVCSKCGINPPKEKISNQNDTGKDFHNKRNKTKRPSCVNCSPFKNDTNADSWIMDNVESNRKNNVPSISRDDLLGARKPSTEKRSRKPKSRSQNQNQSKMVRECLNNEDSSPSFVLTVSPLKTSRHETTAGHYDCYQSPPNVSNHHEGDCSFDTKPFSNSDNDKTPAMLSPLYVIESCQTKSAQLLPLVIPSNDLRLFQLHLDSQNASTSNFAQDFCSNRTFQEEVLNQQRKERTCEKAPFYSFNLKEKKKPGCRTNKNVWYETDELTKLKPTLKIRNNISELPNSQMKQKKCERTSNNRKWEGSNSRKNQANANDCKNVTFSDQIRHFSNLSLPTREVKSSNRIRFDQSQEFASKNISSSFKHTSSQEKHNQQQKFNKPTDFNPKEDTQTSNVQKQKMFCGINHQQLFLSKSYDLSTADESQKSTLPRPISCRSILTKRAFYGHSESRTPEKKVRYRLPSQAGSLMAERTKVESKPQINTKQQHLLNFDDKKEIEDKKYDVQPKEKKEYDTKKEASKFYSQQIPPHNAAIALEPRRKLTRKYQKS